MNDDNKNPLCNGDVLLRLENVKSGYGKKVVLEGISFAIKRGTIIAIIGPNGSGKSTILKTIFGLVKLRSGFIEYKGISSLGMRPNMLIDKGMVYMPQGNRVFDDLSVHDNLWIMLRQMDKTVAAKRMDNVGELFPVLRNRFRQVASQLSAGQKQQLAFAMAMVNKPEILLMDEPSMGLAPNMLTDAFEMIKTICHEQDMTILLVEHKIRETLRIADWVLGLRRGEIVEECNSSDFNDGRLKKLYFG